MNEQEKAMLALMIDTVQFTYRYDEIRPRMLALWKACEKLGLDSDKIREDGALEKAFNERDAKKRAEDKAELEGEIAFLNRKLKQYD